MDIKIYGYASVRTGHRKNDLIANLENTKLYSDYINLVQTLKSMSLYVSEDTEILSAEMVMNNLEFIPENSLQVDIITGLKYYKLDCIIDQARELQKKGIATALVTTSVNAFGNIKSIKKYYAIFREVGIGVLILDNTRESGLSEYSTLDFGFIPRDQADFDRAFELVEHLEEKDILDGRGRMPQGYSPTFRVAFWLYEMFAISEKVAVAMSGFSKNGFHMKADSYEQTLKYKKELEKFDQYYGIHTLMKRNRPVPVDFDKLSVIYEKTGDLERACIQCKIPMIFPIDFERLTLKAEGGRKELSRCTKQYSRDIMLDFEEWTATGNAPEAFYERFDNVLSLLEK